MVNVKKLVFIVSDTLRRDHLGFYGNTKVRTPNLDRFSKKCVIFDRSYANSFPTMPARADMFTGKYTYTYLGWNPLSKDDLDYVLAQRLRLKKYFTAAVVDTPFFRGEVGARFMSLYMNYDRGFLRFMSIPGQGGDRMEVNRQRFYESDWCAPNTLLTASKWLERNYKRNFFLYVDTWDPHEPWDPPQWYVDYYYPGYDGKVARPSYWYYKETGLTDEDIKKAHAAYCGEITMVDRWVGYLLDTLEALNILNETAIIFTSDHGFYFGEHGMFGKTIQRPSSKRDEFDERYSSPLYEEVTRVPLLIYCPGLKSNHVEDIVGLADLMPTVLELMGIEIPERVQAQSLVPLLIDENNKGRDFAVTSAALNNPGETTREVDNEARVLKEWPLTTITKKEWSLLYAAKGQPAELYHLPSDPKQEKNLINDEPDVAQELLNKFVSQMEKAGTEPHRINPRSSF